MIGKRAALMLDCLKDGEVWTIQDIQRHTGQYFRTAAAADELRNAGYPVVYFRLRGKKGQPPTHNYRLVVEELPEGGLSAAALTQREDAGSSSMTASQVDHSPLLPAPPSESSFRWPVTTTDRRENLDVGVEPKGPSPQERHGVRSAEGVQLSFGAAA